jgi:hypothetical protein
MVASLVAALACATAADAAAPASAHGADVPAAVPTDAAPGTAAGASSIVLALGAVEIVDPDPRGLVSFEYRYATGRYRPSPWLAAEATGNDRFFGFGAFVDVSVGRRLVLTPAFGAGIYLDHGGMGLGWHLEFRSSIELTWRVGATRLGAGIAHYSSAGLGDTNPGTEALRAVWVLPLGGS